MVLRDDTHLCIEVTDMGTGEVVRVSSAADALDQASRFAFSRISAVRCSGEVKDHEQLEEIS